MMKNDIIEPLRTLRKAEYTNLKYTHSEITSKIISCCLEIHSFFAPGLLESIYEDALTREFEIQDIAFERQKSIELNYKGRIIGNHRIDFLVEDEVVVELKAVEAINNIYLAQLITYLKVMDKRVGLLINFNVEKLQKGIKRIIL